MQFRSDRASLHKAVSLPEDYQRPSSAQLKPSLITRAGRAIRSLVFAAPTPAVDLFVTTVTAPTANDPLGFDAYVYIGFAGWNADSFFPALVDSGNTMLIIPRWEDIQAIPNWHSLYTVLGQVPAEPWGCPANIVRGPIQIETAEGESLTISNCEFYACTADSSQSGMRTCNFGAGCISPWKTSDYNAPAGLPTVLQSPLSYLNDYPLAEFHFVGSTPPVSTSPSVSEESILRLHSAAPAGFTMMDIVPNLEWMALRALSLMIGNTLTNWPGSTAAIAMLDTGGGPAYLTDPSGFLYKVAWPPQASNPSWTTTSTHCNSTLASAQITLGDGTNSFKYEINESLLPASAQGLVLVMCQDNYYMMRQYGMNVGGISMLAIRMLVDFQHAKVGLAQAS